MTANAPTRSAICSTFISFARDRILRDLPRDIESLKVELGKINSEAEEEKDNDLAVKVADQLASLNDERNQLVSLIKQFEGAPDEGKSGLLPGAFYRVALSGDYGDDELVVGVANQGYSGELCKLVAGRLGLSDLMILGPKCPVVEQSRSAPEPAKVGFVVRVQDQAMKSRATTTWRVLEVISGS